MDLLRKLVETFYDIGKERIFDSTSNNPEIAHENFIKIAKSLRGSGLDSILLDCRENVKENRIEISNAAGFNKNGEIHPFFLKYLGFDRVVIGTVTAEPYSGNPMPRIRRYEKTESLVNWMGLPGVGVKKVAENIISYGYHDMNLTINLMATPGKKDDEILTDLTKTVKATRMLENVDRYELNISCPNIQESNGSDPRKGYLGKLSKMLEVVNSTIHYPEQEIDLKVSPDLTSEDIQATLEIANFYEVARITTTNTTRKHDPRFILYPPNKQNIGGASGNALWEVSREVQGEFERIIKEQIYPIRINSCGGINSVRRAKEASQSGLVKGIQIYTGLIFQGPKLIRKIRESL